MTPVRFSLSHAKFGNATNLNCKWNKHSKLTLYEEMDRWTKQPNVCSHLLHILHTQKKSHRHDSPCFRGCFARDLVSRQTETSARRIEIESERNTRAPVTIESAQIQKRKMEIALTVYLPRCRKLDGFSSTLNPGQRKSSYFQHRRSPVSSHLKHKMQSQWNEDGQTQNHCMNERIFSEHEQ